MVKTPTSSSSHKEVNGSLTKEKGKTPFLFGLCYPYFGHAEWLTLPSKLIPLFLGSQLWLHFELRLWFFWLFSLHVHVYCQNLNFELPPTLEMIWASCRVHNLKASSFPDYTKSVSCYSKNVKLNVMQRCSRKISIFRTCVFSYT